MGQRNEPPEQGPRGETAFNTPQGGAYVDPRLAGTPAGVYAAGRAARASRGLPKADMPVAGGALPPIPALDGAPSVDGPPRSMADHANVSRVPPPGAVAQVGGGIVQPFSVPMPTTQGPRQHSLDIRPTDLLPPQAQNDPEYQQGMSAPFASAQPHLAAKYGVIRNGQPVPPQKLQLQTGERQLRPETLAGLQALNVANQTGPGQNAQAAVAAASAAEPPPPEEPKLTKEEVQAALSDADNFQIQQWKEMLQQDDLNNVSQRSLIESRLQPLKIDDLITRNYCEQRIPIHPKVFEITLRTSDGETDLALKRLVMEESRSLNLDGQYFVDKYVYYGLVAALTRVNDTVLPPYTNEQGNFDDKLFMAKASRVLRFPLHMLASIGVQHIWFEQRVRRLFRVESLGNG